MESSSNNPNSQIIAKLIADYDDGYLNEEILARAIANRADQAGLNAVDLAKEFTLIVLGIVALGVATVQTQAPQQTVVSSTNSTPELATATATPAPNFPGKFIKPTTSGYLTSKMAMRFHPTLRYWRPHNGIDVGVATGTRVVAPADGVVMVAGWAGECGIKIQVNHGGGWDTRYCHNSRALVAVGQPVKQGETISLSGNTGNSSGPHLHFEIRKDGNPLDPLKFVSY